MMHRNHCLIGEQWDMMTLECFFNQDLRLSTELKSIRSLQEVGIYLMGDFCHFTVSELVTVPAFGLKKLGRVIQYLGQHGKSLLLSPVCRPGDSYRKIVKEALGEQRGLYLDHDNLPLVVSVKDARSVYSNLQRAARIRKPFCYSISPGSYEQAQTQ